MKKIITIIGILLSWQCLMSMNDDKKLELSALRSQSLYNIATGKATTEEIEHLIESLPKSEQLHIITLTSQTNEKYLHFLNEEGYSDSLNQLGEVTALTACFIGSALATFTTPHCAPLLFLSFHELCDTCSQIYQDYRAKVAGNYLRKVLEAHEKQQ